MMLKRTIWLSILISLYAVYAESHSQGDIGSYAMHFQAGEMKYADEEDIYRVYSFGLKPASGETGLRLEYFSADARDPSDEKISSLVWTIMWQNRVFGFQLGINWIREIEGFDDGPEGMVVPAAGFRIGSLKKFYITIEGLTDMDAGPFSWRMHYVLGDGFSNAMAGIYWGDATQNDYFGYTVQLERLVSQRIFFSMQGNFRQEDHDLRLRAGVGVLIGGL